LEKEHSIEHSIPHRSPLALARRSFSTLPRTAEWDQTFTGGALIIYLENWHHNFCKCWLGWYFYSNEQSEYLFKGLKWTYWNFAKTLMYWNKIYLFGVVGWEEVIFQIFHHSKNGLC